MTGFSAGEAEEEEDAARLDAAGKGLSKAREAAARKACPSWLSGSIAATSWARSRTGGPVPLGDRVLRFIEKPFDLPLKALTAMMRE